jgi:hypothetical protein
MSIKKRKEMVIGEESFFTWVASCIFTAPRAPVKGLK